MKCLPRALYFSSLSFSSLPLLPRLKCILVMTVNNSKSHLTSRTSQDQPAALQGFPLLCSEIMMGPSCDYKLWKLLGAQAVGLQHSLGAGEAHGELPFQDTPGSRVQG